MILYFIFFSIEGSLCEWRSTGTALADDYKTFRDYRDKSLERLCEPPEEPASLEWTPDENTPNLVYYQVNVLIVLQIYVLPLAFFCRCIFNWRGCAEIANEIKLLSQR